MKNTALYFSVLIIYGVVFFSACKSKKTGERKPEPKQAEVAVKPDSSKDLFKQVIKSKNYSESIYFSSTAEYNDGKQDVDLAVELSAVHGQYIYMNVKAMGLINVARVMIKADSIRILDMINRTYISASYQYLARFTSAPLTFEQVQNMVWANAAFDPESGKSTADSSQSVLRIISKLNSTLQTAVYSDALKTQSVVFSEQAKMREMLIKFEDVRLESELRYPHRIVIHIQGEKNMDCKFTINNFATVIKKDPQFVVPKTYKVQVF